MTATWYDAIRWQDQVAGSGHYLGRHRRVVAATLHSFVGTGYVYGAGFDQISTVARALTDAKRAEQAVEVLAATDHLPASRLLYAELHRAGALTNTGRAA